MALREIALYVKRLLASEFERLTPGPRMAQRLASILISFAMLSLITAVRRRQQSAQRSCARLLMLMRRYLTNPPEAWVAP